MRRWTRWAGPVVAVLLASGCTAGPPTRAAEPGSTGPDSAASGVARLTDGRPAPRLAWRPCPDAPEPGVECAGMAVPRDYRDPGSPTLTVAVTRLRATDPDARRGVLVANPGGPGNPGRWAALGVDGTTGHQLRRHYDLIGMDPRGVGASAPVRCGMDGDLLSRAAGDPAAIRFADDLATAREAAAACTRAAGAQLPYISTADTARDLDLLRSALGEPRLSYVGTSYGTSLGTTFASVFPDRVDRVLLDSQFDDTVGWPQRLRRSNAAVDARFAQIAERIAADPRWELGSPADVRARYLDLRDRAVRGELSLAGTPVTPGGLRTLVADATLSDGRFVDDVADVLAFFGRVRGAPDERELATRLGTGGDSGDTSAVEQQVSAGLAVVCNDPAWSRTVDDYRRTWEADRAAYPVSNGERATVRPCAFWPTTARDPLPTITDRGHTGSPNVLILQNEGDTITPPDGARRTRQALGSRAVLVTTSEIGHVALGRNRCVTDAAVDWLADGRLPESDTTC